jgi:uncharacterized protein RhaS with RHS repeats
MHRQAVIASYFMVCALVMSSCDRQRNEARRRISPEYDKTTGKLKLLKYDSNGDGTVDTLSYMDGARVVRIEIDKDQDGKIDRWEYYDANQKLEKIGMSRARDGKEDSWSYLGADGSLARIDVSTRHDGKVNRVEHYEKDVLVAAEEDADGDGKMDQWETYDGDRLVSIAFDTTHRGTPDRRLIYAANGAARLEVDPSGSGQFVAVSAK